MLQVSLAQARAQQALVHYSLSSLMSSALELAAPSSLNSFKNYFTLDCFQNKKSYSDFNFLKILKHKIARILQGSLHMLPSNNNVTVPSQKSGNWGGHLA